MSDSLLKIQNLHVWFGSPLGKREILKGIDFTIKPGEVVVLTGPSGVGKSLLTRAALGLLPETACCSGEIAWEGRLLRHQADWRGVRGHGMTLVLQEPRTALNPVLSVEDHLGELVKLHQGLHGVSLQTEVMALLAEVRIPAPEKVCRLFPHQLSGGMRQRVLLAGALACQPRLLFADEITSALDAANRGAVLTLLDEIRLQRKMAVLLVSHDLDLLGRTAWRTVALAAGKMVVQSPVKVSRFRSDSLSGVPGVAAHPRVTLRARNIQVVHQADKGGRKVAVAGVDLDLWSGRMTGLAGESGCGKSSLALALSRHLVPAGGSLELSGGDFLGATGFRFRQWRRKVQLLFQDPGASLDPRQTVASSLIEACGKQGKGKWADLLAEVDLARDIGTRLPHQLSGGQRQRVALARCLAAEPDVLLADEPTTQLDPSTRDKIIALLQRVMANRDLAVLMIAHDLPLLLGSCTEVGVMLGGRIVEWVVSPGERLLHPYSLELLTGGAVERPLVTDSPRLFSTPDGADPCIFRKRCPWAKPACSAHLPPLRDLSAAHSVRCHELP